MPALANIIKGHYFIRQVSPGTTQHLGYVIYMHAHTYIHCYQTLY